MPDSEALHVLLAPAGELCGNGQLRETIKERRARKGSEHPMWYLSPELVKSFSLSTENLEAVVAQEISAINWLQLRFGGEIISYEFDISLLREKAMELPPSASPKDISC
tara:strand:+ start:781 stop:1107 length:327 start_codon:yes stop_codon:yes gene_type:complete